MHHFFLPLILFLVLSIPLRGQVPAEAGKSSSASQLAGTADARKLPNDTLTVGEAKVLLSAHTEAKRQLEVERQAVLAKASKLNAEERGKLIGAFLAATEVRRKKIQDDTPRMSDLSVKVRTAEKK